MISDVNRQAGEEYRGVILPKGMTPQCLDRLASLFKEQDDPFLDSFDLSDEVSSDVRAAIKAFEIIRQELPQKSLSQSR